MRISSQLLAWGVLVIAGACEFTWAAAMASAHWPLRLRVAVFALGTAAAMGGLYAGLTAVPVGAGYAAWVGSGTVATVLYSTLRGHERLTAVRALFLAMLLAGIVGAGVFG